MTRARITGRVVSGLGQGRQFTGLDWARRQFVEKLGIDPYPGTLNLAVEDANALSAWRELRDERGIVIDPPDAANCSARCYKSRINGRFDAAIVLPEVPGYPETQIELIAAISLRDLLGVADGDRVTVEAGEGT